MKQLTIQLLGALLVLGTLGACNKFEEDLTDGSGDSGGIIGSSDNSSGDEIQLTDYRVAGDAITKIKDYQVAAELQPFQNRTTDHREMWDFVVQLFPQADRNYIKQFEVFHGQNSTLGYVYPPGDDLGAWAMGLDIYHAYEQGSFNATGEFGYTTVHEMGHIYTLNETQFDETALTESGCGTYFNGNCAFSSAMLNDFYNRFWKDIAAEYEDAGDDENALDAFYERYSNQFVTAYAASSPEEDIAESFSAFILEDRPTGNSVANQKVNFFYHLTDMVALREHVRTRYNTTAKTATTSASVFKNRKGRCVHRPKTSQ